MTPVLYPAFLFVLRNRSWTGKSAMEFTPVRLLSDANMAHKCRTLRSGLSVGKGCHPSERIAHSGDVNAYATFNLSDYKTKVTQWDSNNFTNTYYTGKEYGEIWGFETDRYFDFNDFNGQDGNGKWIYKDGVADQTALQSGTFVYGPGDVKFVDQNGDGKIDWGKGTAEDHGDLVKIGNSTPRYQYSLRLGAEWKGFDIDLYMQGVGKRDMWTQSAFVMPMTRGVDAIYANQTSYITEEMFADGIIDQNADFPRMFGGGAGQGKASGNVLSGGRYNFYPQTKYLVNMAYLRMKNITVGYTLPKNIVNKLYASRFRVCVLSRIPA